MPYQQDGLIKKAIVISILAALLLASCSLPGGPVNGWSTSDDWAVLYSDSETGDSYYMRSLSHLPLSGSGSVTIEMKQDSGPDSTWFGVDFYSSDSSGGFITFTIDNEGYLNYVFSDMAEGDPFDSDLYDTTTEYGSSKVNQDLSEVNTVELDYTTATGGFTLSLNGTELKSKSMNNLGGFYINLSAAADEQASVENPYQFSFRVSDGLSYP